MAFTLSRISIGGARLRMPWSWLVVALVVAAITAESHAPERASTVALTGWYAGAAAIAALVIVSVLAHDAAHLLAARRTRQRVVALEPPIFGALSESGC